MKISVQVHIQSGDDSPAVIHEVFTIERGALTPDTVGLQLDEARDLLAAVQEKMITGQARAALAGRSACPDCGAARRHKDSRDIVMRTLFGTLHLASPRWWHCTCRPHMTRTFSPLAEILPDRATPELLYLEARFAGLASYGLSARLLAEILPLGRPLHATAVRLHAQAVTFLTDGAEDVRDLPLYLNPGSEHLIDWFHLTMRITVMANMAKSLQSPPPDPGSTDLPAVDLAADVAGQPERLKWFCWHGNLVRALGVAADLLTDLDVEDPPPEQGKLARAVDEFGTYLRVNASFIPNYGERYRAGEPISSSIAESVVNQVIAKRMVKRQQMRWIPRGAHLLLQVRTRVLNQELADVFHRWYPGFTHSHRRPRS